MRVYLDNVADSGRILGDLDPAAEMEALRQIVEAGRTGVIELVTSRESWREQERTNDPVKLAKLEAARGDIATVARDHLVLGHHSQMGMLGTTVVGPLATDIVDNALYTDLIAILGLEAADERRRADPRHLTYAATNACVRFVTLDHGLLGQRTALDARCEPLCIVKPSELVAELSASPRARDSI